MSPSSRQMVERTTGKILSSISADVSAAWSKSDNGQSFANALADYGMTVHKGRKEGVFIIRNGDQEVGALDRLIKRKEHL